MTGRASAGCSGRGSFGGLQVLTLALAPDFARHIGKATPPSPTLQVYAELEIDRDQKIEAGLQETLVAWAVASIYAATCMGGFDALLTTGERAHLSFRREDILGRDLMIKLSNYDGRFVVRLLELRRAAILEMTQQLPEQSCKERAAELRRLDAVLTQIKAGLPQITDLKIADGR
jgi:hypothetical protein